MITLTRRQARRLRGVFCRSALGIAHRGPIPPLVFSVVGDQVCARHRYAHLAVEQASPLAWPSSGTVALPCDALADFEGKDDATVALDPVSPDRTVVRWSDRGIPQVREYVVPAIDSLVRFPSPPAAWTEMAPGLLDALTEATDTAADDSTRYALGCLQLRGGSSTIAATDGRQVLIRSGFAVPWDGDILISRSPLFGCKDLTRDQPVQVGKTDDHVVLRVGAWTIWCEIKTGVRFPDVDRVLPDSSSVATRLRLDPGDARFLLDTLDRLPGADLANGPATVDLNGRIAIRARAADQAPATELVLSRSVYSGTPVRFQTNREYLARAIRLGCGNLEVADADSPVVGRSGDRIYAWQPLSKESAIEPADDIVRIEAPNQPVTTTSAPSGVTPERKVPVSQGDRVNSRETDRVAVTNPTTTPEVAIPTGLAALIAEAEALHESLGEARSRAGRLVVALRKQKRREKLVAATLASLRELRLQDVAG